MPRDSPIAGAPPVRHRQRPHAVGSAAMSGEVDPLPCNPLQSGAEPMPPDDTGDDTAAQAEAEASDDDAHTARLRDVLRLIAQHMPQTDIARRYGVADRTVRRWVEEARRRRLGTFKRATADDLLADTDFLHADLKARLLRRLDVAETGANYRLALECIRQLRGIERDRYAIRSRIGAFDNWNPPQSSTPEAPGMRQPSLLAYVAWMQHSPSVVGDIPQSFDDFLADFDRPDIADADHPPLF